MTARIAGFVTRAQAGLVPPKSISHRITPEQGGVGVHWGGPAQLIDEHNDCLRTWRGWQAFHTGPSRRWADIAYTGGFCDHGYALAGRGAGIRTAANGTNAGNDDYYAVVWLGGQGETPTGLALDALDWWIAELRHAGGAGQRVRPHTVFTGSACPGPVLIGHAASLDNRPITVGPPAQEEDDDMEHIGPGSSKGAVQLLQRCLIAEAQASGRANGWPLPEYGADGSYGEETQTAIADYQQGRVLGARLGIAGGATIALLVRYEDDAERLLAEQPILFEPRR